MEGRQEVERNQAEFTRIVKLVIKRNAVWREPSAVLIELLEKYLSQHSVYSTSLFEIPDVKLVKAMLVLLKTQNGDPIRALIWHLNGISQRIQAQWPIVQWLSAFFAVYQQYAVHFDETCTPLFASPDVWHNKQLDFFDSIFIDLQSHSEAISLAAFGVLIELRFAIPPEKRNILINMINVNLDIHTGKPFKLAILQQAKLIHEWLAPDKVPQKVFLENLLKNVYNESKELSTAACAAIVDLHHFIDKKLLVAYLRKIIKKIKHELTNWFLIKACDVLPLLSSVIPPAQCVEIVAQLLIKIDSLDVNTAYSARSALWKFLPYIPLNARIKLADECEKGLACEADEDFLTAANTLKFLDDIIPDNHRFKIVDILCQNLCNETVSAVRRLATLECIAGIMHSIPVNLHSEVIDHVCALAMDKTLPHMLRQQAIYTLKKLRFIFFIQDCKNVTNVLLNIIADTAEDFKLREEAIKALQKLDGRILFNNVNHVIAVLLNTVSEVAHPGVVKLSNVNYVLNEMSDVNHSATFKMAILKVLAQTVRCFEQKEYLVVKDYFLKVLHDPGQDFLVKIQAAHGLRQISCVNFAEEIIVAVKPFVDLLESQVANKNLRAVSFVCDLLRALKPLLSAADCEFLIDFLLLKLSKPNCANKVFLLLADYLPEMDVKQKITALCLLNKLATLEDSCHHEAKKLFIQIYHEHKKCLIAAMLERCTHDQRVYILKGRAIGEPAREYLPNHIREHIIRLTN